MWLHEEGGTYSSRYAFAGVRLDEDLRELERLAAAAPPGDAINAARLARALERSGDVAGAVAALVRATDAGAGGEALVALDRLARGGVDPLAAWPSLRGDARHSGRSIVAGPTKGAIVGRTKIPDLRLGRSFCVDADRVLVPGGPQERPELRAGWRLTAGSSEVLARSPDGATFPHAVADLWWAGLGLLVSLTGTRGLEARLLREPGTVRARWPLPRGAAALAVAPGGHLLALSKPGVGGRGSLHRFDLATLRALPATIVDPIGLERDEGSIVVAPDGIAYLGIGGAILALDPEGKTIFRREGVLWPAALAGPEGEVLVACDPRNSSPVGLDRHTGAELWRTGDQCLIGLPKVDATGRIFWRREEELVALDARSGELVLNALVGGRYWDFAFAGDDRIACLRSVSPGVTEHVVVE